MSQKIDYNDKTERELQQLLLEKRSELRKFRFGGSGSKIRDTKRGKNLRKDIARILTELNKRVKK